MLCELRHRSELGEQEARVAIEFFEVLVLERDDLCEEAVEVPVGDEPATELFLFVLFGHTNETLASP